MALMVYGEQLSRQWRRFTWTFHVPPADPVAPLSPSLRIPHHEHAAHRSPTGVAASVRAAWSGRSAGKADGQPMYVQAADLPSKLTGRRIWLYENRLAGAWGRPKDPGGSADGLRGGSSC